MIRVAEPEAIIPEGWSEENTAHTISALVHAAECALATVEHYECQKRPHKGEWKRHETIANTLCAYLFQVHITPSACTDLGCTRVSDWLKKKATDLSQLADI